MTDLIQIPSISSLAELARKNPTLLNVGSLSLLRDPINKTPATKSCNCPNKKPTQDLSNYRPQFEAAMSMLSSTDQQKIKTILDAKKVCYFAKDGKGQIKKICF